MIPINEYIDTLISAKRYEIIEEKKIFGGLFNKKNDSKTTSKPHPAYKSPELYTKSQYEAAKSWLEYYMEEGINCPVDMGPRGLAYCGITYAQFKTSFNKEKSKMNNSQDGKPFGASDNFEEGSPAYNLFENNLCYSLAKESEFFFYFPKLNKFLLTYLDEGDYELNESSLQTYEEIIKDAKDYYFTIKPEHNDSDKRQNQIPRAYIAADKNLGYYRLSKKEL